MVLIRAYGIAGPDQMLTTNRNGTFEASGLDRLVYQVSASAPAYTTLPRDPDSTQAAYYRVGDSLTLVLLKGRSYHRPRYDVRRRARSRRESARADDSRRQRSTVPLWRNIQRARN